MMRWLKTGLRLESLTYHLLAMMNEPNGLLFTGFSVNASSFLIDVDRNVGDFGHTVVWEIGLVR